MKRIEIYDTTLRDGAQGEGISFSGPGKIRVAKRLEQGTFRWPTHDGDSGSGRHHATIRHDELAALLGGLDIVRATRRRWHRVG